MVTPSSHSLNFKCTYWPSIRVILPNMFGAGLPGGSRGAEQRPAARQQHQAVVVQPAEPGRQGGQERLPGPAPPLPHRQPQQRAGQGEEGGHPAGGHRRGFHLLLAPLLHTLHGKSHPSPASAKLCCAGGCVLRQPPQPVLSPLHPRGLHYMVS